MLSVIGDARNIGLDRSGRHKMKTGADGAVGGVVDTTVPADAGTAGGVIRPGVGCTCSPPEDTAAGAGAAAAVDTTVPADAGTATAAGAAVAATIELNHADTAGQFS